MERTIDHYHTFFVQDNMVYDVWFDMMQINDATRNQILKALIGVSTEEPKLHTMGQPVKTDAVLFEDSFPSDDGTVSFNVSVGYVPEELEAVSDLGPDVLLSAMVTELKATTMDGYGLPTKAWGYEGVTCEVNVTNLRIDNQQTEEGAVLPVLIVEGERIYHFSNGNSIGLEQGIFELMTINALDGTILYSFGHLN